MNTKTCLSACALALSLTTGCSVDELLDDTQMPVSENGVYTDDGRFFVAGGDTIYEIVGDSNQVEPVVLLQDDCVFGGLVDHGNLLYSVCMQTADDVTTAQLYRIDPTLAGEPDVQRAALPVEHDLVHLNGMDFGPGGALYISNSAALVSGDPAVIRVSIESELPLVVNSETFLDASTLGTDFGQGGGLFPNGVQIDGDTLYLARGIKLVKMALLPGGAHGPLETIYQTDGLAIVDDFDIADDHIFIGQANLLGLVSTGLFDSKLVITDMDGDVENEVDLPVIPSSTAARRDTLFGEETVIVTSFFHGGLYRVTRDN